MGAGPLAAYADIVKRMPGYARAASSAGLVARQACRGLVQVLAGPDAPPAWWHPPWRRRAYLALSLATLALLVLNLDSVHAQPTATPAPPTWCRASPCYYFHYPPIGAGQVLLAMAVVTPLLLAARYPLLGWRIGWLALLLAPLVPAQWRGGWPWGPAQVLVLLVLFCVAGARYRRPALWWMWALSLIPWWLWLIRDLPNLNGPISATILFTVGTIALDSLSSRWGTERALAAQTERTELERARRAVLEERSRIARELHDVVAHHMSLIAVQAETAPYRLSDLPESAIAEFASLSGVAREALAEMRRLLGVLRSDQPTGLAPQPQLSDLPALVDAARRAGVSVELAVPGAMSDVPSGVALCAYRIVQESLSNASQHAPGAAVSVSVGHDGGVVLLRVANGPGGPAGPSQSGPAGPSQSEPGSGHGLTGMRERVALLGGSLSAGPSAGGGFVVSAVLPLGKTA
jgi:signal transduction histidine kinase